MNQTVFSARNSGKMSVFVLQLQHNCFFVGRTKLKQFALEDLLKQCIPTMARHWLGLHNPLKVFCVYFDMMPFDEDKWVKAYMYHYGIENVRGGSYTTVLLDPLLRRLLDHELSYVTSQTKPQSTANLSQSLLSSRLGDENLTNSVLANSVLVDGRYHVEEKGAEEQTFGESVYEMMSTAYDMVWELGKYVWPWQSAPSPKAQS